MKCFRCFSFVLFALLGVFFGSFIINQNNTYALDDYSITINKDNVSLPYYLCGSDSGINCSDYSYLSLSFNDPLSSPDSSSYIRLYFVNGNYFITQDFKAFSAYQSVSLSDFNLGSNLQISILPISSYSGSVTYTFFNSLGGSTPSGSLEITENGTYDVSQYTEAVVNVPETDCPPGAGGNYHEDLVAINNSIMICAATCLVIYFFYCIYRMIIKNSGVK